MAGSEQPGAVACRVKGQDQRRTAEHHAYLKATDLPKFLKKLEVYDGALQTKLALRFALPTITRSARCHRLDRVTAFGR